MKSFFVRYNRNIELFQICNKFFLIWAQTDFIPTLIQISCKIKRRRPYYSHLT